MSSIKTIYQSEQLNSKLFITKLNYIAESNPEFLNKCPKYPKVMLSSLEDNAMTEICLVTLILEMKKNHTIVLKESTEIIHGLKDDLQSNIILFNLRF